MNIFIYVGKTAFNKCALQFSIRTNRDLTLVCKLCSLESVRVATEQPGVCVSRIKIPLLYSIRAIMPLFTLPGGILTHSPILCEKN